MTGAQALALACDMLRDSEIGGAERDARWLLAAALGVDRGVLVGRLRDLLSEDVEAAFLGMVQKRCERVPMSHVLGGREFYGRWFKVTSDVLDPRPDTETLIELALGEPFSRVLDLGTGSGAIAVTLLAERLESVGVATDVSERALRIAEMNGAALGVSDRLTFVGSDWFEAVEGAFDLVVSNPPYIALDEMPGLQDEVRLHEPAMALTDGGDGLACYRLIAANIMKYLTSNGRVILEIGPTQAASVSAYLREAGLIDLAVHHDIDGRDRCVSAKKPTNA